MLSAKYLFFPTHCFEQNWWLHGDRCEILRAGAIVVRWRCKRSPENEIEMKRGSARVAVDGLYPVSDYRHMFCSTISDNHPCLACRSRLKWIIYMVIFMQAVLDIFDVDNPSKKIISVAVQSDAPHSWYSSVHGTPQEIGRAASRRCQRCKCG